MLRLYFLFARLFIFKKQPHLRILGSGQIFTNWFYQKILKINYDVPFQVHYTSRLTGYKNIKIIGDPAKVMISFASSGGCYYAVSHNATFTKFLRVGRILFFEGEKKINYLLNI